MKKILFLLLVTISSYAQTYQNPTFGTVKSMTAPTVSTTPTLGTIEANGTISKIVPNNVPITYTPINYAPSSTSIADQLAGIDTRLGQIGNVTAGVTTRVHLTGDNITVTAGTFFASNTTGKGATAAGTPQQTLSNNDDQKQYFTKDVMSVAVPALTTAPPGVYSGQLTVTSDPTPGTSKQRFTIEIYKCNNGGTPIASGITGAPVGNLGVTVVAILDSGLINVVASALTNIGLQGNLASTLTLNTGERLRYHVSAEKVGTDGGAVTMNVYYGSNYNSYYDIPVTFRASNVLNDSGVSGQTVANALDNLDASALHKTGNETFSGIKSATNDGTTQSQLSFAQNATVINRETIKITQNSNFSSSILVSGTTEAAMIIATGINTISGNIAGLNGATTGTGAALQGTTTGVAAGLKLIGTLGSTGDAIRYEKDGVNVFSVNSIGNTTANQFIKTGGTATQGLLANGGTFNNPIGGTGTTGQLSFWNGSSTQTGDALLFWDNTNKRLGVGTSSPVGRTDILGSRTSTYTSSLTSPVTDFLRVSNTHNSGSSDQFSTLALHVSGNNMSNNSYATLSAIQPTAANNNSEFSLALRQAGGSMVEVLRATTSGISSPVFTGNPTAPTPTAGDNDTSIATTAFVSNIATSGSYTPSATNIINMGTVITGGVWTKVGTTYTVRIKLNIASFTTAGAVSTFTVNLPVAKTTSSIVYIGNGVMRSTTDLYPVLVEAAANTTQALITIRPVTTAGSNGDIIFMYDTSE